MTVERHSEYATTNVFSLNNFHGEAIESQLFRTPFITATPILAEFSLFNGDPSGSRHLLTHPSFVQILASGASNVSMDLGPFDLEITNVSPGSGISKTRCMIFRINEFDCSTSRISDMKVWASDLTDFLVPQSFRVVFETRQQYPSGLQFPVNYLIDETKFMPTSVPDNQNLFRQDGGFTIHGSGDADVSEYICVSVAASGTLPLGEYVGDPDGFQLRVTYNLDNLFILFD